MSVKIQGEDLGLSSENQGTGVCGRAGNVPKNVLIPPVLGNLMTATAMNIYI